MAVELEVAKEFNKLLYSVETMYLNIIREVAVYAVVNNVTSATQLQRLFTVSIGRSIRACMLT